MFFKGTKGTMWMIEIISEEESYYFDNTHTLSTDKIEIPHSSNKFLKNPIYNMYLFKRLENIGQYKFLAEVSRIVLSRNRKTVIFKNYAILHYPLLLSNCQYEQYYYRYG